MSISTRTLAKNPLDLLIMQSPRDNRVPIPSRNIKNSFLTANIPKEDHESNSTLGFGKLQGCRNGIFSSSKKS